MPMFAKTLIAGALLWFAAGAHANPEEIATASGCQMCHTVENQMLGPAYKDIAAKYASDDEAAAKLIALVRAGSQGVWGSTPMAPIDSATISDADLETVILWILAL